MVALRGQGEGVEQNVDLLLEQNVDSETMDE